MYLVRFLFHVEYPVSCNERIKFAGISLYRLFICWEFLSLSRRLENWFVSCEIDEESSSFWSCIYKGPSWLTLDSCLFHPSKAFLPVRIESPDPAWSSASALLCWYQSNQYIELSTPSPYIQHGPNMDRIFLSRLPTQPCWVVPGITSKPWKLQTLQMQRIMAIGRATTHWYATWTHDYGPTSNSARRKVEIFPICSQNC